MDGYQLNGEIISRAKYLSIFQNMVPWIDRQIKQARDDNEPAPVFHTKYGPLVVVVDGRARPAV